MIPRDQRTMRQRDGAVRRQNESLKRVTGTSDWLCSKGACDRMRPRRIGLGSDWRVSETDNSLIIERRWEIVRGRLSGRDYSKIYLRAATSWPGDDTSYLGIICQRLG